MRTSAKREEVWSRDVYGWLNVNAPGDFNKLRAHDSADRWSGVLYLAVPDISNTTDVPIDAGCLGVRASASSSSPSPSRYFAHSPRVGDLVLFSGAALHAVSAFPRREISRTTALECAAVHTTTHAQAYQRIQAMMVAEGDGKLLVVPVKPSEYRYNLWQNYMLFVCSTDGAAGGGGGLDARQVVTIGQRGSLAGLLQTVIPRLGQSNVEVDAIMRLFQLVPAQSKATILSALLPLQSGLMRYSLALKFY